MHFCFVELKILFLNASNRRDIVYWYVWAFSALWISFKWQPSWVTLGHCQLICDCQWQFVLWTKICWIDELSPAVIPQKCCINYCRTNTIPSVNSSIFLLCSRRVNLIKSLNGYAMFQSIIQTLAQISTLENFCFSSTFLLLFFFFDSG